MTPPETEPRRSPPTCSRRCVRPSSRQRAHATSPPRRNAGAPLRLASRPAASGPLHAARSRRRHPSIEGVRGPERRRWRPNGLTAAPARRRRPRRVRRAYARLSRGRVERTLRRLALHRPAGACHRDPGRRSDTGARARVDRLARAGRRVAAYTAGDLYYALALSGDPNPPYPSPADLGYVAFYPASYAGLLLLLRARTSGLARSIWLDGAIAAAGVAALAVAVLFESVLHLTEGSAAGVAMNLVYPLGDATLLAAVVGVLVLNGRRLDRTWLLIGGALAATAIADAIFLIQSAAGTYVEGAPARRASGRLARCCSPRRPSSAGANTGSSSRAGRCSSSPRSAGRSRSASSSTTTTTGSAPWACCSPPPPSGSCSRGRRSRSARTAACSTAAAEDSVTDALTGLGNRRRLLRRPRRRLCVDGDAGAADDLRPRRVQALQRHVRPPGRRRAAHPARRTARDGGRAAGPRYRLGGDEFCVLGDAGRRRRGALLDAAAARPRARRARASSSRARSAPSSSPRRPATRSSALHLADQRLYAQKRATRPGAAAARRPAPGALASASRSCSEHAKDVAELARRASARQLGLDEAALERARPGGAAARRRQDRHPGLDPAQAGPARPTRSGRSSREHTVIGERILGASPGAAGRRRGSCARRHERWDGTGYPDGLAGRADPARGSHHRRLRRVLGDDARPPLPRAAARRGRRSRSSSAAPGRSSTRRSRRPSAPSRRWSPPGSRRSHVACGRPRLHRRAGRGRPRCRRRGRCRCSGHGRAPGRVRSRVVRVIRVRQRLELRIAMEAHAPLRSISSIR